MKHYGKKNRLLWRKRGERLWLYDVKWKMPRSQGTTKGTKWHKATWVRLCPDPLPIRALAGLQPLPVSHVVLSWVLSPSSEERLTFDCLVQKVGQLELCNTKPQSVFTCTLLLLKAALINVETHEKCVIFHVQTFIQHSKKICDKAKPFFLPSLLFFVCVCVFLMSFFLF